MIPELRPLFALNALRTIDVRTLSKPTLARISESVEILGVDQSQCRTGWSSCRCEANLCTQCGEPLYEFRLGANIFNESTKNIIHIPGMLGSLHNCGKPRIEMPQPIRAVWGGEYAEATGRIPAQLGRENGVTKGRARDRCVRNHPP
jgi:hypothetical protein